MFFKRRLEVITRYILLVIYCATEASAMAGLTQNVLATQGSANSLTCPKTTDCSSVTWVKVTSGGETPFISQGLIVYDSSYTISSTSGACVLNLIILEPTDAINCVSNGVLTMTFYIYILTSAPVCQSNNPVGVYPADGDSLTYTCQTSYNTGVSADQNIELQLLDANNQQVLYQYASANGTSLSLNNQFTAVQPTIPQYTCRTTFGIKTSASPIMNDCIIQMTPVQYGPRNVRLLQNGNNVDGNNFIPGTNITCMADGFPTPTYQWNSVPIGSGTTNGPTFTVYTLGSTEYQCVASNMVKNIPTTASSSLIMFNTTVAIGVSTASASNGWIAGVVFGVLVLVAAGVFLVVCFLWPRMPLYKRVHGPSEEKKVIYTGSGLAETAPMKTTVTLEEEDIPDSNDPDLVPKQPKPTPRRSIGQQQQARSIPKRPPDSPPPKRPAQGSDASSELLYAEVQDNRVHKPRPPRPSPSSRSDDDNVYTAVARS